MSLVGCNLLISDYGPTSPVDDESVGKVVGNAVTSPTYSRVGGIANADAAPKAKAKKRDPSICVS